MSETTKTKLDVDKVYLEARRLREDQTFDLIAQRMENIVGAYRGARVNADDTLRRLDECRRQTAHIRAAIRKAESDFVP